MCCSIQIHGFADAATEAYGATLYLRVESDDGIVTTSVIVSKSKVSPMKIETIPHLELCAALLLAKLTSFAKGAIRHYQFEESQIFLWSDSQIVLYWLNGDPNRWKVFVANRITKILRVTKPNQWRCVNTTENPADFVSRGLSPLELNDNQKWFHGPSWLTFREESWPLQPFHNDAMSEVSVADELKSKSMNTNTIVCTPTDLLLNYCSDLTRLLRFTSWYRRFFRFLHDKRLCLAIIFPLTRSLRRGFNGFRMFNINILRKKS